MVDNFGCVHGDGFEFSDGFGNNDGFVFPRSGSHIIFFNLIGNKI
jgi:hypothetical protein